jgi:hypothetical protein
MATACTNDQTAATITMTISKLSEQYTYLFDAITSTFCGGNALHQNPMGLQPLTSL